MHVRLSLYPSRLSSGVLLFLVVLLPWSHGHHSSAYHSQTNQMFFRSPYISNSHNAGTSECQKYGGALWAMPKDDDLLGKAAAACTTSVDSVVCG